jgi:galactokinase
LFIHHFFYLFIYFVFATILLKNPFEIFFVELAAFAHGIMCRSGGFWAYSCGVAYKMLTDFRVSGLEIHNYRTTLPLKKGLSSSAAICVLTVRAFSRVYDLKITVRGEMEYAYQGSCPLKLYISNFFLTHVSHFPLNNRRNIDAKQASVHLAFSAAICSINDLFCCNSRCGRMDQGCAFGSKPIIMSYDGEFVDVDAITVPRPIHMLVVDLCAAKDTVTILKDLQGEVYI